MASFKPIYKQNKYPRKQQVIKRKKIIKKQNPNKKNKTEGIFQILLVLVIAIIIVVTFVQKKSTENYNDIKLEKGNFLVYTKYEDKSTKYTKEVPYVNLKADVFKQVNSDILLFCNEYMQKDKSIITYEYDINGIILSLVIKVINNETTYAPEPYFRTYNINLETEEVISPESVLEFYGITKKQVEHKIQRKHEAYYSEIIKQGYYTASECSYDCYLRYRGITGYLEHVSYYIRDGKLIAFKSFIAHSIFGEEEYFNDKSFEFEIANAPLATKQDEPLKSIMEE